MKKTLSNAKEIHDLGGAIAASDWTTGSGNYISRRAVPQFCQVLELEPICKSADTYFLEGNGWWEDVPTVTIKGYAKKGVATLRDERPRTRKAIVLTDIRGYRKAIKQIQTK